MEDSLDHLSDEQVDRLIRRYYDGEMISTLLREYKISVRESDLFKLFPPETRTAYFCEHCGENLVLDRLARSNTRPRYERELYCPHCDHWPYQEKCECDYCREEREYYRNVYAEEIRAVYSKAKEPIDLKACSLTSRVFLGALCKDLLRNNLYEIEPYNNSGVILAPTEELRNRIYSNLIDNQIISVSPNSSLGAFDTKSEHFPNKYDVYKVTYFLNLDFPPNKQDLFTEIFNPRYCISKNANELYLLWREIALSECVEYLQYQLDRVGFKYSLGEKTYKTFESILLDFSVSQVYGIIWRSVADASKLYLESGIGKKHAANSVIGACARLADRARQNGWNLTHYNRINDLPQSELSSFFFNNVLKIGKSGFRHPPSIDELTKISGRSSACSFEE